MTAGKSCLTRHFSYFGQHRDDWRVALSEDMQANAKSSWQMSQRSDERSGRPHAERWLLSREQGSLGAEAAFPFGLRPPLSDLELKHALRGALM